MEGLELWLCELFREELELPLPPAPCSFWDAAWVNKLNTFWKIPLDAPLPLPPEGELLDRLEPADGGVGPEGWESGCGTSWYLLKR